MEYFYSEDPESFIPLNEEKHGEVDNGEHSVPHGLKAILGLLVTRVSGLAPQQRSSSFQDPNTHKKVQANAYLF